MINWDKLRQMRQDAHKRDAKATLRFGLTAKIENSHYVIDVPGKPGYFHVREVAGDTVIGVVEAINGDRGVARKPNIPVRLDFNDKRELEIFGLNRREAELFAGQFPGNLGVPPHSHAIGGGLEDPVETRRLKDLFCYHREADPALTMYLAPYHYKDGSGDDQYWAGGTIDLTGYRPGTAGTKCWAKVGFDTAAGQPVAVAGTAVGVMAPLDESDLAAIAFTDYTPSAGVILRNGQTTSPVEADILDCRQPLNGSGGAAAGSLGYILIQDQKAQNTSGGSFTSGAWQTRTLSIIVTDTTGLVSLASNQIVLPAGTYRARINAPAFYCDQHQIRLQNVTDTTTILTGTSEVAGRDSTAGFNGVQTRSSISGRFTIAASKSIEVQHRCATTQNTNGFGLANNFTTEVYTVAEFEKE